MRRDDGSHHNLQDLDRCSAPFLADLDTVSQVAQIAEHAGILNGALLLALIGGILSVRADEGKYALEDGAGKLRQLGGRGAGGRVQPTEAAELAVVVGVLVVIVAAIVEARLSWHAASKLSIIFGERFSADRLALVALLAPFKEAHQPHVGGLCLGRVLGMF